MNVPRRNPMTGREAAICGRVQEFRRFTDLSRTAFAKRAGIDTSALVRYELHRAALKYADASRLNRAFYMSPEWLATGTGSPMSCVPFDDTAFAERTPFRALFTAIYDRFVLPELKKQQAALESLEKLRANPPESLRAEMLDYSAKLQARAETMREGIILREARCRKLEARVAAMRKDLQTRELYCAKIEAGISGIRRTFGSGSDQAYWTKVQALAAAMAMAKQSAVVEKRKLTVDTLPASGIMTSMTSETGHWEALVKRVRALTAAPGQKARLARELNTTRQAVNKWLSGTGAPSAEITLRLLNWVNQQEQKPNTLGSATNTVKGKTQLRSSKVYEKTKSNPQA
jgi:transcriptional regulator with XRE-family HTH domain